MRLLWLGSYESEYPRNRVLINGLRELDVEVIECHAPIWEAQRHKAGGFLSSGRLLKSAGRLGSSWLSLGRAQAREGKVDAIVLGYPSQLDGPLGWAVSRYRRAPLVVDAMVAMSDAFADRGIGAGTGRLLSLWDRTTFGRGAIVVADTGANARWLSGSFGIPAERVAAVPVGADPQVFAAAPVESRMGHALFVGKLSPLHGVDVVLEAARKPGVPPIKIIGSGQLEPWLEDELRRDPPPGISHVPWVDFLELGDEVRAASVSLGIFSASSRVGRVIPNKVWQAMAVGRPIVTADGPAVREVLRNERDALLVPPADPDALADALRRLAGDAELRTRLGTAARRRYLSLGSPARVATRFLAGIASATAVRDPAGPSA